jgi:SAM-dependent methyltransferase
VNPHVTAARVTTNPTSAAYFARAEPYLRRNHRIALRSEIVRELIGEPSGKRILDLGCGNGAISLPYAKSNAVMLVDNSAAMLEAAREAAAELGVTSYTAHRADASSVEVEPADIVLAIGVLAHVDDAAAILGAAARNLKSGGLLVLQLSDASRCLNRLAHMLFRLRGRDYRPTRRADILAMAAANGLSLVGERSHLLVLPGMPRLLGAALVPYDRFIRRHPALARHGVDTLLLLQKR